MSKSFYPKLALSNIVKNKRIYFPYIFTCIFTVMMFYVMSSIKNNKYITLIRGADTLKILLNIGLFVIGIFSIIFLFYTNSFLMKRRKKEIGLYNILGMEKRHIGKMMCYETLIITIISLVLGLLLGMLFSKLMFLFLLKLISFEVVLGFDVPMVSVIRSLILFGGIFLITLLYNLAKIHLTKPIELLHGGEFGEKEPKTKVLMTMIGLICIGLGYGFALMVESPLDAMNLFFIAVVLVIAGTYALFTSGSIVVLKMLRKNKKFYYKTKHFTNVSGMLYRMKQNAVGLANICILSTMVLIMFSTTFSLYAGMEDSLKDAYPNEIGLTINTGIDDHTEEIDAAIDTAINENGVNIENYTSYHYIFFTTKLNDGKFQILNNNISALSADDIKACMVIPLDEFNQVNDTNYTLNKDEVLLYSQKKLDAFSNFTIANETKSKRFEIKEKLNKISSIQSNSFENMVDFYTVIVNDMDTLKSLYSLSDIHAQRPMNITYSVQFDTNYNEEDTMKFSDGIFENMSVDGVKSATSDNIYEMRATYYEMYGGFLFIGLFLGILFLMATVLIIYYKQITEGYEDKERFEIMQKVGMSHLEVKKTIRSQVLMVFFIPLIVTGIHIAVSFRIIRKMLMLIGLANGWLFVTCTIGAMLIFCVVYGIVFTITAKSYYKIVSTAQDD